MRRRTLRIGLLGGFLALLTGGLAESAGQDHEAAGMAAYRKLQFREAARHFQDAVDSDPGSAAALYYLGYSVYKMAEPRRADDPGKHRAAELFARAYQIDPGFVPAWGDPRRP